MPSNGIFARVLQEGEISVRDTIQVLPETGKEPFRAAVITLSDKGAAGEREDKSDPLAEKLLTEAGYEVRYCQYSFTHFLHETFKPPVPMTHSIFSSWSLDADHHWPNKSSDSNR